jgi:hypothetical protein
VRPGSYLHCKVCIPPVKGSNDRLYTIFIYEADHLIRYSSPRPLC